VPPNSGVAAKVDTFRNRDRGLACDD